METHACFTNAEGELEFFSHQGVLGLYQKENNQWIMIRSLNLDLSEMKKISDLRVLMEEVLLFLSDTKTILVKGISGIPYYALEKGHMDIWEAEGSAREALEEIAKEMDMAKQEATSACVGKSDSDLIIAPEPVMISEGVYQISLKEIQGNP